VDEITERILAIYLSSVFNTVVARTGADNPMRTISAVVHPGTQVNAPVMMVKDLIHRVELLMNDKRYPPLYIIKADLKIPFHIKYPRP
jgi:hypothetical protein